MAASFYVRGEPRPLVCALMPCSNSVRSITAYLNNARPRRSPMYTFLSPVGTMAASGNCLRTPVMAFSGPRTFRGQTTEIPVEHQFTA
jgi:hypothetical protein